jgi:hypothetical protein
MSENRGEDDMGLKAVAINGHEKILDMVSNML